MLLHSLFRTTTMTAAFSLLLFLGLGFAPVLGVPTGSIFPAYPPWEIEFYYYDTVDGTPVRGGGDIGYLPVVDCKPEVSRADFLNITLHQLFRFVGYSSPDCDGYSAIFDIRGDNLTFYQPPGKLEAYKILWLGKP